MLFKRAKRGARGKEATKRETNPNWMTAERKEEAHKNSDALEFIIIMHVPEWCALRAEDYKHDLSFIFLQLDCLHPDRLKI